MPTPGVQRQQSDPSDFLIDIGPKELSSGLYQLLDDSESPLGSSRLMYNMMITDRGGIAPRPGTQILGAYDGTNVPLDGVYNFAKSDGITEIPVKAGNGVLKYYDEISVAWQTLNTGYTPGSNFGFKESVNNSDNADYLYFCNQTEEYSRWIGQIFRTTSPLVGTETSLPVDSIFTPQVFATGSYNITAGTHNGTVAVSTTSTTQVVTDSAYNTSWVDNCWVGATLTFTSGVLSGAVWTVVGNDQVAGGRFVINGNIGPVTGNNATLTFIGYGDGVTTGSGSVPMYAAGLTTTGGTKFGAFIGNGDGVTIGKGTIAISTLTQSATSSIMSGGDTFTVAFPNASKTQVWDIKSNQLGNNGQGWQPQWWLGYYLHWLTGSNAGSAQVISANSISGYTLGTSTTNNPAQGDTYELRYAKIPTLTSQNSTISGTFIANGLKFRYSSVTSPTSFTIAPSGGAIPSGSPVTLVPDIFPQAPQGNRLETYFDRMIVGNVQQTINVDKTGNAKAGYSPRSFYWSTGGTVSAGTVNLADPTNFSFATTRVAGQGGYQSVAYGGGNITDIVNQEGSFYVSTKKYIEADSFSTDGNDNLTQDQLKTGFGSVGRLIKGKDDIYFVTEDNQITSIQRIKLKDTLPQQVNLGITIKRLVDTLDFTQTIGIEYKNRLFIAHKSDPNNKYNDQLIVYNERTKSWEGIWKIGACGFFIFETNLHFGESYGANVWEMFVGQNDVRSAGQQFPVTSQWRSNRFHVVPRRTRFHVTPSKFETTGVDTVAFSGYIQDGTVVTISMFKDYETAPALTFDFGVTGDTQFEQAVTLDDYLGANPLGLQPLGSITPEDPITGYRYFMFIMYFPPIYSNYLSFGLDCTGLNQYYEFTRFALNSSEDPMRLPSNIKT